MHHIKAEYFLFHIVYVTQLFFFVRYDSYCNVSTHMCQKASDDRYQVNFYSSSAFCRFGLCFHATCLLLFRKVIAKHILSQCPDSMLIPAAHIIISRVENTTFNGLYRSIVVS